MTKAKILKRIEELKKQIEALLDELKQQTDELLDEENKIRTNPLIDECYFSNFLDKNKLSIGNYFKSEEDAEMVLRAMQIEHSIRIRRIELNDGWEPDWDDLAKEKYHIVSNHIMSVDKYVNCTYSYDYFPIFGYYKSEEIARQIIDEFKDDLYWYFNAYYPNKDRMYVWGD